jgi:hypothetical protein
MMPPTHRQERTEAARGFPFYQMVQLIASHEIARRYLLVRL